MSASITQQFRISWIVRISWVDALTTSQEGAGMIWQIYVAIGVLLLVIGFIGTAWFQVVVGAVLIIMGIDKRRRG